MLGMGVHTHDVWVLSKRDRIEHMLHAVWIRDAWRPKNVLWYGVQFAPCVLRVGAAYMV